MDRNRDKMPESIINLTLEILFRLTGEDYTIVKKTSRERCQAPMSKGWIRTLSPIIGPPPHPLMHEEINRKKILELTNKMIELLTGEVPIRCQDVTIYFSMEEWEYLEGHKDLYKDVMMDDHQSLTPPVKEEIKTPERCPSPLLPRDGSEEHHNVPQDDQLVNLGEDLNIIYVTETDLMGDEQSTEDIPTDNRPDDWTGSLEEHLIFPHFKADDHGIKQDTCEEHLVISDVPAAFHKDLSSDPLDQFQSYDSSQTSIQNKSHISSEHQITHTEEKGFSYSQFGKYHSVKSSIVTHQRTHTGEKPYSCSECGRSFNHKSNLVKHERIHTGEKPFSCSECGKCFNRKSNLLKHHRIHTGEKPFSCTECGKCFTDKSYLAIHRRIHTGERPFSCSECGKCFIDKAHLVKHEKIHTGQKPFSCSECIKDFNRKSNLVKHQIIHSGEKPFSCSECEKLFYRKSDLLIHERIHTGAKPFSCSECEKCFNRKSHLVIHERLHTGDKPYSCSECGKYFNDKSVLVKHQRIHTGEKPFSCSECEKCFSDKSHLVKHERIHTGEKPYFCSECGKSFKQRESLVIHHRSHTEQKPF
ncbi:zinc finger protein 260-like [Bufo gargarizans]|uniref:zinc finger protein 260-like n=1 Tax=Bufo gargarizans TaxID=30331 RepID=UPI001CF4B270|nr:zinc finger protein 260-like [Bufo gargarizans]XP_044154720.1 zinc finger protein 260-like [Bufo gargarizans]